MKSMLKLKEHPVVELINPEGSSPIVLVCEHASNRIPNYFGSLGLSKKQLESHIAWDPGARNVAIHLANSLDAPLIASTVSRLVYDCNRPPESIGAIPKKSENIEIMANNISKIERLARVDQIYRPFEKVVTGVIENKKLKGIFPVLITIHSFTPVFLGDKRNLDIGILHGKEKRLADAILAIGKEYTGLRLERNQPYSAKDGVLHTLERHGESNNLLSVMIEIKNSLISTEDKIVKISEELKSIINQAAKNIAFR